MLGSIFIVFTTFTLFHFISTSLTVGFAPPDESYFRPYGRILYDLGLRQRLVL